MAHDDLITRDVRRKLGRLRRGIRAHLAAEGLAAVAVALAALVAVTFLSDWGLHKLTHQPVPRALRATLLAVSLAAVAYVAWRFLLRPALMTLRADDLALVVESHYPHLGDRLISAVQFARRDWRNDPHNSPALVARMAEQANAAAAELDFAAPLDRRRLYKRLAAAGAAVVVVAALATAAPGAMYRLFLRNILLSNVELPQETYLVVEGGPDFAVVRGDDLTVTVRVRADSSVVPRRIRFHMHYASVGRVEETVAADGEAGVFTKLFPAVAEPLEFYVTGNDDRTAACTVRIIEPPQVRRIDLRVEYPAYTDVGARDLLQTRGAVDAPPGSYIAVTAAVTKPVAAARLLLDGRVVAEATTPTLTLPDEDEPCQAVVGGFRLLPGGSAGHVASSAAGRRSVLQFELVDLDGRTHGGNARCLINLLADQAPALDAAWLGMGKKITAYAAIPLEVEARDDYGLTALRPRIMFKDLSREPLDMPAPRIEPPVKRVAMPLRVDLQPLALAGDDETTRLAQVWVEATDTLPPPDGPNVGRCDLREYEIVPEAQLQAELGRQQQEMRLRMDLALQAQAAARDAMLAARDQAGGSMVEALRLCGEAARQQQSVSSLLGSIAQTYREMLATKINNRLGEGWDLPFAADDEAGKATRQRLRANAEADRNSMRANVIEPLSDMVGEPMSRVQAAIAACRDTVEPAALIDNARAIAEAQQAFYQRMTEIRDQMGQLETLHEIAQSLNRILLESLRLKRQLEDEVRRRTSDLFDRPPDGSTPSQP